MFIEESKEVDLLESEEQDHKVTQRDVQEVSKESDLINLIEQADHQKYQKFDEVQDLKHIF